jgi:hypothetical protein
MLRPAHVASNRTFNHSASLRWASSCGRICVDASEAEQTSALGLDRCFIFDHRGTIKGGPATCGELRSHTHSHTSSIVLYTPIIGREGSMMTKQFLRRIVSDVLIVLVSVMMITTAATFLGEPIRSGIAASLPGPFHLAMERRLAAAEPSTPKFSQTQPRCRLRSAPLQWNVDWLFRPPEAPG